MQSFERILGKTLLVVVSAAISLLVAEFAVRALDLAPALRDAVDVPAWDETADQDGVRGAEVTSSKRVPHPYVGWTHRPGTATNNIFGLPSEIEDFRQLPEEDFVIAITGGSVALGIARRGGQTLADRVETLRPELKGQVRIVTLALGGYKQPQQLIQVLQMLILGVPIDAVVNIDGFNELAMGGRDAHRGLHPFLPAERFWAMTLDLAANSLTPTQLKHAAEGLRARQSVDSLRIWAQDHSILSQSQVLRTLLGSRIVRAEARAAEAEQSMATTDERSLSPVYEALTDPCAEEGTLCADLIAEIWSRASQSLQGLAESFGVLYLHILQPNQYVKGSKELTKHELEVAWAPEHPWSLAAAAGYPVLIERGEELTSMGVDFHDFTGIFDDQQDAIYSDTCCHYNDTGYGLVAEAIADRLVAALERLED